MCVRLINIPNTIQTKIHRQIRRNLLNHPSSYSGKIVIISLILFITIRFLNAFQFQAGSFHSQEYTLTGRGARFGMERRLDIFTMKPLYKCSSQKSCLRMNKPFKDSNIPFLSAIFRLNTVEDINKNGTLSSVNSINNTIPNPIYGDSLNNTIIPKSFTNTTIMNNETKSHSGVKLSPPRTISKMKRYYLGLKPYIHDKDVHKPRKELGLECEKVREDDIYLKDMGIENGSSNHTLPIQTKVNNTHEHDNDTSKFKIKDQKQRNTKNTSFVPKSSVTSEKKKISDRFDKARSRSESKIRIANTAMNPNATITYADLERFLKENRFVRQDDENLKSSKDKSSSTGNKKLGTGGVAVPQLAELSERDVEIGAAMTSSAIAFVLATSIQPNLWLIGVVLGLIYGQNLAKEYHLQHLNANMGSDGVAIPQAIPGGLYGDICIKVGRILALNVLKGWYVLQGIWFMYRTGQLSYEYYKRFSVLDEKFAVQAKIDAWNARFIEGKRNFDAWERENEVGRKVLAGLRTIWLVEEKSLKSQYRVRDRSRSKYRIVQIFLDMTRWFRRFFYAMYKFVTGAGKGDLQELMDGIKTNLRLLNLEVVSQRFGSAIAALIAVNIVGATFAVAPYLLGILALFVGITWPNWVGEVTTDIKEILEETKAKGRGENISNKNPGELRRNKLNPKEVLLDRDAFHFFRRADGTKRWYRTGQSMFTRFEPEQKKGIFFMFQKRDEEDESFKSLW